MWQWSRWAGLSVMTLWSTSGVSNLFTVWCSTRHQRSSAKSTKSRFSMSHWLSQTCDSPDGAAARVQVMCRHRANDGAWGRVLVHLQEVGRLGEDWRLVHVQDVDSDCGRVLEGAQVEETRVRHSVGHLDLEGVPLPGLVVKLLQEDRRLNPGCAVFHLGPVGHHLLDLSGPSGPFKFTTAWTN